MITENINWVSIREVLSRVTDHPLMRDVSLEKCISLTVKFIAKMGMPKLYMDKQGEITISEYRGVLPCDLIQINQVRDSKTHLCFHSMTNTFMINDRTPKDNTRIKDGSYKIQGRVIYTSLKEGVVEISYRAMPLDDDGLPMVVDDEIFLEALELFIKKKIFTELRDLKKLDNSILQDVKQEYFHAAGQCHNHFLIPNKAEMMSIINMWCTMIPSSRELDYSLSTLGVRRTFK